jgi:ADP-L-glycero-D-manno-heptose 6-epimerase
LRVIVYAVVTDHSKDLFMDKPYIIVTGGAGFIGSALVRHLNDNGIDHIVIVDHLGMDSKWANLVGKRFADIIGIHDLFVWLEERGPQEVESFVHLGACSSTVEQDASYLLENNYRYTRRLAEYALKHDKPFVYASSAATYGDGSLGFTDDEDALDSLRPLNMYGYSKHLFDLWAKREGVLHTIAGLKYFNVFGPNEGHKGRMASVITKMVPDVQREGIIRLFKSTEPDNFGDGDQKRDFIYVKDAVRMTYAFLRNRKGGIYNIGRGVAETWNTLAGAVFDGLETPRNIHYMDMPADLIGKYQNYTCAEMSKTQKAIGSDAKCDPLHVSVVDYVKNYLVPGRLW